MSTEDQLSDNDIPDDQVINDIFLARATKHAEDAVDYEDIDELADDEDPLESFGGDLAQQADACLATVATKHNTTKTFSLTTGSMM